MTDLFQQNPTIQNAAFHDLWAMIPTGAKSGKREAQKAFAKLRPQDQKEAYRNAKSYYEWWRKANPQASWLHPSTYINQRRWEDEAWKPAPSGPAVDRAAYWAKSILDGSYVSPGTCPASLCREMLQRGLVTENDLRERGLSA